MRVRVSLIDPSSSPDHLPCAAVAAPGEPVWIGRSPAATLCVPADDALHARHALVVCYERACRVFDASGRGLTVDGVAVDEALLRDGSVVRAGATVARVDMLPNTPAPDDSGADAERDDGASRSPEDEAPTRPTRVPAGVPDAGPAYVAAVSAVLRRAPAPLYAIIDAARRAPGVGLARAAQELMAAIPDDVDELDYADAAPYLVRLVPESPLLARLLEVSWGHAECVFLTSTRPFAEVRAFLRDLMDARLEDGTVEGRRVFFRFYDPVVLAHLLSRPGLDAARFFGPVRAWYVEAVAAAAAGDADAPETDPAHSMASAEQGGWGDAGGDEPVDDAAWLERPEPPAAAPSRPSVLLDFRPQLVILRDVGPAVGPRTSAVRVVQREHDLPEVDTAT